MQHDAAAFKVVPAELCLSLELSLETRLCGEKEVWWPRQGGHRNTWTCFDLEAVASAAAAFWRQLEKLFAMS